MFWLVLRTLIFILEIVAFLALGYFHTFWPSPLSSQPAQDQYSRKGLLVMESRVMHNPTGQSWYQKQPSGDSTTIYEHWENSATGVAGARAGHLPLKASCQAFYCKEPLPAPVGTK